MLSTVPDKGRIVQNLSALSDGSAVQLNWDFYGRDSKINYIAIEKSELGSAGNECRDCPRTFERIGQIPVKKIILKHKDYDNLNFTDKKVKLGKTYNYRLLLCNDFDICLESSATEINFNDEI